MEVMKAVSESVIHLCDIMGAKLESGKNLGKGVYGSSIPVQVKGDDGKMTEYQFYLYFKKGILKSFAEQLLQSSFTEYDLDDISRELANQIIGYAKNILSDANGANIKLGTPEFLGAVERFPIKFTQKEIYKINNRILQIGYKKA